MGIAIVMSMTLSWSFSNADTIIDGRSAIGPAASYTMTSSLPIATEAVVKPLQPAAVPIENGLVLQTLPTLSKSIAVGETMLVPYIGAGFGGGYATEFDRSINTPASASSGSFNVGLRNLFGPQLIPNEVQMGIRFPF